MSLAITVCHLPPGTSKWNKVEPHLFSFITQSWRGRPLVSHQVIVQLIAGTTTKAGLKVDCELDPNTYPAGTKVADAAIARINLHRHDFHGDWNYTIVQTGLTRRRPHRELAASSIRHPSWLGPYCGDHQRHGRRADSVAD